MKTWDVVVIGAGPGGSSTAYFLAQHGLRVLLLDKASFPRDKTCGDGLTPRALRLLQDMGLLADLLPLARQVGVLEMAAPGGSAFLAPFPAVSSQLDYALTIPRLVLDDRLRERALASGANFDSPVRVSKVSNEPGGVAIRGERAGRPVEYQARVAVIATGAHTGLLTRSGILRKAPQVALAARAYFEGIDGLDSRLQLRFDNLPLPGYGWVFPLPGRTANIGAGIFPVSWKNRPVQGTAQAAFQSFLASPALRRLLAGARQAGPLKGHPLRIDFPRALTSAGRILLVGEAAGLVNPLTGEGIDYALESGKMAAGQLLSLFAAGDLSPRELAGYDRLLRRQYQALFLFCTWWRDLLVTPRLINPLVATGARFAFLKMLIIQIVFGKAKVIS